MIWLWLYLASILPVMLTAGFLLGRVGYGPGASAMAVALGAAWPIAAPCAALVLLTEWAVQLGEKRAELP